MKVIATITLSLALLVAVLAGGSFASAPGDSDKFCDETYTLSQEKKVLMYSRNYAELLPGSGTGKPPLPNAVWSDVSCDNNDRIDTAHPTFWQHGESENCPFPVRVCGYSAGDQNNWLFTQHISTVLPSQISYPVRVFVEIGFIFESECQEENGCKQSFKLLKHVSTPQWHTPTCSDTTLFSGDGIMHEDAPLNTIESSRSGRNIKRTYSFDLNPGQDGFYLALHDSSETRANGHSPQGTCVHINYIKVYRYECQAKTDSYTLVRYPATPAPAYGSKSVMAECVENARRVSDSLIVPCMSKGWWNDYDEFPECVCNDGYACESQTDHTTTSTQSDCSEGYQKVTAQNGNEVCQRCPAGTYSSQEDTSCQLCPANTQTDAELAGHCACVDGYFRNDIAGDHTCSSLLTASIEGRSSGCSRPPSAPEAIVAAPISGTSIGVMWAHPSYTGGRADLYYTVERSEHDNPREFSEVACKESSFFPMHRFDYLKPATQYCVRVTAHNGVSDQDPDGAQLRTVEQCLQTPET